MTVPLRDTPVDRVSAAVGGGALVVAALLRLLPSGSGSAPWISAWLLLAVGLVVLAVGLPAVGRLRTAAGARRDGVLGSSPIVRGLVVATAAVDVVVLVLDLLALRLGIVWFGPGAIDYLPLLLLIGAGLALARTPGSTRYARYGIGALALLGVLEFALGFAVGIAAPILDAAFSNGAQALVDPLVWLGRLLTALSLAVGVWFAWPWAAPRVDAGTEAVKRVHERHVDSTP